MNTMLLGREILTMILCVNKGLRGRLNPNESRAKNADLVITIYTRMPDAEYSGI